MRATTAVLDCRCVQTEGCGCRTTTQSCYARWRKEQANEAHDRILQAELKAESKISNKSVPEQLAAAAGRFEIYYATATSPDEVKAIDEVWHAFFKRIQTRLKGKNVNER